MNDSPLEPWDRPAQPVVDLAGDIEASRCALLAACLADGFARLDNVVLSDEIRLLIEALRSLGVRLGIDDPRRCVGVAGGGGFWLNDEATLSCGNRLDMASLLLPAVCLGNGRFQIADTGQVPEASLTGLIDALRHLGAQIHDGRDSEEGTIDVLAAGLRGGRVRIDHESTPLDGLLLVAPCAQTDVFLELAAPRPGDEQLRQALHIMDRFQVQIVAGEGERIIIPAPQRYDLGSD